jgi:hypothetical protein
MKCYSKWWILSITFLVGSVSSYNLIKKRAVEGPAAEEAINKAVQALPADSFAGDQDLAQMLDRLNGLTTYSYPSGHKKEGKLVFRRKASDKDKSIVILEGTEDQLRQKNKRTYVVLKSDQAKSSIYTVFYAYVR